MLSKNIYYQCAKIGLVAPAQARDTWEKCKSAMGLDNDDEQATFLYNLAYYSRLGMCCDMFLGLWTSEHLEDVSKSGILEATSLAFDMS